MILCPSLKQSLHGKVVPATIQMSLALRLFVPRCHMLSYVIHVRVEETSALGCQPRGMTG